MADVTRRFLIVDDHPLFRNALSDAIAPAHPAAEIIEAGSIAEAVEILKETPAFDLALLDLRMPDARGFDGLLRLRTHFPKTPIVAISDFEEPHIVGEAIAFGAVGFIPKSSKRSEVVRAVTQVMAGAVYVPPGHDESRPEEDDGRRRETIRRLSLLTPQQLRVLRMLQDGLLNKQIAHELRVGETTVKAHVSEILKKLNVVSRTQAAMTAAKLSGEDVMRIAEKFPASDTDL